jgi:hypothetical protein
VKYIVLQVENPDGVDLELPVIFPDALVHRFVAEAMVHVLRRRHDWVAVPVSAGSINLHPFSCSGESETLKLKARPQDRDLIAGLDYSHGVVDPGDRFCRCGHQRHQHGKEDGSGGCCVEVGLGGCSCRAFRRA